MRRLNPREGSITSDMTGERRGARRGGLEGGGSRQATVPNTLLNHCLKANLTSVHVNDYCSPALEAASAGEIRILWLEFYEFSRFG